MPNDRHRLNAVLELVEEGVIRQQDAANILDVSQGTVSNHLREEKYSDIQTEKVNLDRDAVMELVRNYTITQTQAADILGITQSAVLRR